MKKVLVIIFGIVLGGGFLWAGIFYWENLRGIGPAVLPPSQDIGKLIEQAPQGQKDKRQEVSGETKEPLPKNTTDMPLALADGFSISIFARDIGPARVMTWDPKGNVLVSITGEGKVVALPDRNHDGVADEVATVISALNRPHGLAFREGKLYIAETDQVATYDYDPIRLKATNKRKIIDLPGGEGHFTRTIMFAADGRLLTSVGSSCNVCNESDWRRAKILVSNPDGSDLKVFASGLRNAVFMTTHLVTGEIWATEMGRDLLGDDLPPDEINMVEEGKSYGWPLCYGKNIHDTEFDRNTYIRSPCQEPFEISSYLDLPAHSAPLGLAFIPEEGWPQEYWYNLLVAYHGSWNRSVPTGYNIVRFKLDEKGNYLSQEDFISGWLQGNRALGRPVDILVQPGGTVYISDDKAGVVYRVSTAEVEK